MSEPTVQTQTVNCADGSSFDMRYCAASDANKTLLVIPAMGVKAKFYDQLLQAFARNGFNASALELRGHGSHSVKASRDNDYGYETLVELDVSRAVQVASELFNGAEITLFGHSLGGQLGLMYLSHCGEADRYNTHNLIICAGGSPYVKAFANSGKLRMQVEFVKLMTKTLGYYPGDKTGFGGRDGARLMLQWAKFCTSGKLKLPRAWTNIEYEFTQFSGRVDSITFTNDELAPRAAADHLLGKCSSATIRKADLPPVGDGKKPGHFAWAKEPETTVAQVQEWLA